MMETVFDIVVVMIDKTQTNQMLTVVESVQLVVYEMTVQAMMIVCRDFVIVVHDSVMKEV